VGLCLPTGCHAPGTEILLGDGGSKKIEEIGKGDAILGPDGKAREVIALHNNRQLMVRIIPTQGPSFVVNVDHLLPLWKTTEKVGQLPTIEIISIRQYLLESKWYRHTRKLQRSPAIQDFSNGSKFIRLIDPYFMGILLGDGSLKNQPGVTTADETVVREIQGQARKWGLGLRISSQPGNQSSTYFFTGGSNRWHKMNHIRSLLEFHKLWGCTAGTKFIPLDYLRAGLQDRLELLAGLLDSDGYLQKNCYEYTSKSGRLAEGTSASAILSVKQGS